MSSQKLVTQAEFIRHNVTANLIMLAAPSYEIDFYVLHKSKHAKQLKEIA